MIESHNNWDIIGVNIVNDKILVETFMISCACLFYIYIYIYIYIQR